MARLSQLSRENPDIIVFTSIGNINDKEMLKDCYRKMNRDKAIGIDGADKEEYGQNLEENLEKLLVRLKEK